jgi:hypothetical protein
VTVVEDPEQMVAEVTVSVTVGFAREVIADDAVAVQPLAAVPVT